MSQVTWKNVKAYIQGNLRYKLYYSNFKFLIPKYIREQIEIRINSIPEECLMSGQCQLCGCTTTALQMADKSCDKPCYTAMNDKVEMESLYNPNTKSTDDDFFTFAGKLWVVKDNKFIEYKNYIARILAEKRNESLKTVKYRRVN